MLSFRDLRRIDELAPFNEIELLHPSKDAVVNKYLEELGFNTDVGVLYIPNKHRDLQNKVAVGFRAVGEIRAYSEYNDSPLCTTVERILAAAKTDPSLAREMSLMLGSYVSLTMQDGIEYEDDEEFSPELIEDDYSDVAAEIQALCTIRDSIRGSFLNDYGNIKTPEEYQNVAA